MKKTIGIIYVLLLIVMATATFVENSRGTDFAHTAIYGSWWFCVLWGLLAVLGLVYILKRKVRNVGTLAIHVSFLVILLGAFLTHVTAKRGMMHLRVGETTDTYIASDGDHGMKTVKLPFALRLQRFETSFHDGTSAVLDYSSHFTVIDGSTKEEAIVSMNNIYSHRSVRFYQASYDPDGKGSVLTVNSDPWGIPVTYTGYALLFLSLIWMLIDPKGPYRRLLKSLKSMPNFCLTLSFVFCSLLFSTAAKAQSTLPKETASRFGKICILYNDRICPVQTYALDFCKKVYGARSYKGLTAEQVLAGWIFYGNEWAQEPFIKVKGGALREQTGIQKYASMSSFFGSYGYSLASLVQDYYQGNQDKLHKQAADVDGKIMLIMELRSGSTLKVLPYTTPKGKTTWYAPTDSLPTSVEKQHALYIKNVFPLIYEDVRAKRWDRVDIFFDKMLRYQEVSAGNSLPTVSQYRAERVNNAIPFATILFMANLTLGFIALFYTIYRMTRKRDIKVMDIALPVLLCLSFLALTTALTLRWIISGNIPLSNGYETMLSVAWFVQLISLLTMRRFRIVLVFGFLLSGFFLLVSHINQMDPAIGQMMPVLNSPLLSIHVSIIMMSYALLSLTFICGIMGLLMRSHAAELQMLSRVFLYPAITTMGLGIFIGAIWANISWGTYWSWDSKETWALITFMIYAVVLHTQSLPILKKPRVYHLYMVLAFMSLIMTYFGVNYFLSGMHSYA